MEKRREAGPCHVGYQFWKKLEMDDILKEAGFSEKAKLLTLVMVMNRLLSSSSEHQMPNWVNSTALSDILSVDLESLNDDALYRNMDKTSLLPEGPREMNILPTTSGEILKIRREVNAEPPHLEIYRNLDIPSRGHETHKNIAWNIVTERTRKTLINRDFFLRNAEVRLIFKRVPCFNFWFIIQDVSRVLDLSIQMMYN